MSRLTFTALSPTQVRLRGPEGCERTLLAFAGCNYLGLSFHPSVREALERGFDRFGLSASASRETTGNADVYDALETALAAHVGLEAAILTPEGYTANFAAAEGIAARCRVALIDERSHRSVAHALRAAGLETASYRHRSTADAATQLETLRNRGAGPVALCTDGVFAAAGHVAPVRELHALLGKDDLLLLDDCHGITTLGPKGEGSLAHHGIDPRAAGGPACCVTLTLAKGLGCYGGAVLGPRDLIDTIAAHSGLTRGTTPVPPPLASAGLEALRLCREDTSLRDALRANVAHLERVLHEAGLECGPLVAPIAAFTKGDPDAMEALHRGLLQRGILAPLIDYPGGPAPRYFRLSVNAVHRDEDFESLAEALRELRGR